MYHVILYVPRARAKADAHGKGMDEPRAGPRSGCSFALLFSLAHNEEEPSMQTPATRRLFLHVPFWARRACV